MSDVEYNDHQYALLLQAQEERESAMRQPLADQWAGHERDDDNDDDEGEEELLRFQRSPRPHRASFSSSSYSHIENAEAQPQRAQSPPPIAASIPSPPPPPPPVQAQAHPEVDAQIHLPEDINLNNANVNPPENVAPDARPPRSRAPSLSTMSWSAFITGGASSYLRVALYACEGNRNQHAAAPPSSHIPSAAEYILTPQVSERISQEVEQALGVDKWGERLKYITTALAAVQTVYFWTIVEVRHTHLEAVNYFVCQLRSYSGSRCILIRYVVCCLLVQILCVTFLLSLMCCYLALFDSFAKIRVSSTDIHQ
jgi:hypothetical protein